MYARERVEMAVVLSSVGITDRETAEICGVSISSVRRWRKGQHPGPDYYTCPRCHQQPLERRAYTYLLGLYLGDGHIARARSCYVLVIFCADAWPGLKEEAAATLRAVMPTSSVCRVANVGCTQIKSYSKHWPCLFPQHGPGRKHERRIELEPWQEQIVAEFPGELARGLFHSDGCRVVNQVRKRLRSGERRFEYSRYFFQNESHDILGLCGEALDRLGVSWRFSRPNAISVARRGPRVISRPRRCQAGSERMPRRIDGQRGERGATASVRAIRADGRHLPAGTLMRVRETPRRVVIAEDEALIRLDLKEMLEEEGYAVAGEAGDGRTALELAADLRPDLVILDVKMPVLDGISAAEQIASQRIAPIVILTAFSQRDLVERARDAGAMAYLVKPFTKADLVPAIEMAVSRFAEIRTLESEMETLQDRLEARKLLDRAKGRLQAEHGLNEPDAFRWIQKTSMDRRMTMRKVAEAVLEGSAAPGRAGQQPEAGTDRGPGRRSPGSGEEGEAGG